MSIALACFVSPPRAQSITCAAAHKNIGAARSRVLVLRPVVEIWEHKSFSTRESDGSSEAVQAGFHEVLARTFEDSGYTLAVDPTLMAQWEETPPNDAAVKALQDRYNSLSTSPRSPCQVLLETSVGDDLKKLAGSNDFDLVVLTRAHGKRETKTGKVTNTIEMAGAGQDLYFTIGIVDAITGLTQYYCESTAKGNYIGEPDTRLPDPIRKCLKQYLKTTSKH
jgi:hypothetical protein